MAVSIVNFFLWSVYVEYFSVLDYGTINLLLSMEVIAKIVFRFGLDGAFLRFLYECKDRRDQQRLASTIVFFLLLVDGTTLLGLILVSPSLASAVLGSQAHVNALRLMLLNTFAIGFTFVPFSMLQMERRAAVFSLMTLFRSVATIVLRLVLVVGVGLGISGLYLADLLVTAATLVILARWFVPLIRPVFSRAMLRETLAFGLPRLPHAAAQQVMAVGDKFILKLFVSLDNIGVYGVSVSFGLVQKLFLSAFQSAWAPFIFDTARESGAEPVFRKVTTYGIAILALLTAGLATIGRDTVVAMTHGRLLAPDDPRWTDVQTVITWTALGVFLQGFYLLTSIGLNITKRTAYYPIATIPAAASNVALNFLLIPRFGIVGAAYANGVGYAVQALLGFVFSQRFYRIEYRVEPAGPGVRRRPPGHRAGARPPVGRTRRAVSQPDGIGSRRCDRSGSGRDHPVRRAAGRQRSRSPGRTGPVAAASAAPPPGRHAEHRAGCDRGRRIDRERGSGVDAGYGEGRDGAGCGEGGTDQKQRTTQGELTHRATLNC